MNSTRQGRGEFLVYKEFYYEIGYKGSGNKITVKAGFTTDLCSVPFFARPFVPLAGPLAKPALLHDWLVNQADPRANHVFHEALGVAGVTGLKRETLLLAVKIGAFYRKLKTSKFT